MMQRTRHQQKNSLASVSTACSSVQTKYYDSDASEILLLSPRQRTIGDGVEDNIGKCWVFEVFNVIRSRQLNTTLNTERTQHFTFVKKNVVR